MSEELYFNDELRKCLNAAGLSDCGENDAWDYWYQRVHKAHDQAVDRVTEAQRAENAKLRESVKRLMTQRDERLARAETDNAELRELAAKMAEALRVGGEWCDRECIVVFGCDGMDECPIAKELRELGVEVDG